MSLPVVFHRLFQHDLAAGFDWYQDQRPGLGDEFLRSVRDTLRIVELSPEMFVSVHGDVRRANISRFPFGVFYLVEPRRVVILRLLHTARDPNLWPRYSRKPR